MSPCESHFLTLLFSSCGRPSLPSGVFHVERSEVTTVPEPPTIFRAPRRRCLTELQLPVGAVGGRPHRNCDRTRNLPEKKRPGFVFWLSLFQTSRAENRGSDRSIVTEDEAPPLRRRSGLRNPRRRHHANLKFHVSVTCYAFNLICCAIRRDRVVT